MGFFDKIFGKKDEEKARDEKEVVIQSGDLEDFLKKKIDEEGAKICDDAKPLVSDIIKTMDDIKRLVKGLEKAEYSGDVPKRLDKIIKASKPKYIEGIVDAIDGFRSNKTGDMGYKELKNFYGKLMETEQVIGKIDIHHGRYLPIVYGDYITAIRKDIKRLVDKSSELNKSINPATLKELNELLQNAGQIKDYSNEMKGLEKKVNELKIPEKNLRKEIAGIEKEIKELKEGNEFRELDNMKQQLDTAMKRKNGIETEIYNAISPLKRTLRKFNKIAHEGMFSKEVIKAIDSYIEEPVGTFLKEEEKLYVILNKVNVLIEKKQLMLKGHEKEKVLSRVGALLGGELKTVKERYFKTKDEVDALGKKIKVAGIVKKKRKLERGLDEKSKGLEKVEDELHHIRDKKSDVADNMEKLKKKVESKLSEGNKSVRIETKK
ncbi:MAG: hypothetical protein A7316_04030 [Candidatus Altiarchaeales archaeon WOR_SM1_86-2]|nr:MAG: hypothetical protein A7316_04030 [Candidatus Altiarchaeales archaeon WOR_SM1_86-2]ODS40026.1 MAG: hypothetical protein A7315_09975 [Candidatus Altiarchaeales archaeon WOR_SM1_79]